MNLEGPVVILVLVVSLLSFVLSAAAGLGGSLLLVPALALIVGTKEGIALAALLLAGNNVMKVIAYRDSLPFARSAPVIIAIAGGSFLGASLLIETPEPVVAAAVIAMLLLTLLVEGRGWRIVRDVWAPALGLISGVTSGLSGTSGPLKGAALRSLALERAYFVGAASLASLVGDVTKVGVYTREALVDEGSFVLAAVAVPLMILGTALGRQVNRRVGERGFAVVFWMIMSGYSVRLVAAAV
jgi:uncharacterized membrane protein YfcA